MASKSPDDIVADDSDEDFEEEPSSTPSSTRPASSDLLERRTPRWLLCLLTSVPVLSVAFCGTREPWALGMICILMGLCFVVAPPVQKVGPLIWVPLALALLLSLAGLLPASWFTMPEWRVELQDHFGIALGTHLSPQPLVSLEKWLFLVVCSLWLLYCLGRGFGESDRRFIVRALVVSFSVIAVIALVFRYRGMELPTFWKRDWRLVYFGPFPNRNHFSGLTAVVSILGFATVYEAIRRRNLAWVFYTLVTIPLFAALLLNTSRMGVLLFFVGLGAWMLTTAFSQGAIQRMAVSASLLLALTAVVLLYGRNVLDRFTHEDKTLIENIRHDGRVTIFKETANLIDQAPWPGVGMGNFEPLFNMLKSRSNLSTREHHPENDWLWLAAENGIPVLILTVIVFWAVVRRFDRWRSRSGSRRGDRRLRTAAGVSVLMLAAMGLASVPLHTVGLASLGALLAGIALRPSRTSILKPPGIGFSLPWAGAGLFSMLCGAAWLATSQGRGMMPGDSAADLHSQKAAALSARNDFAGALAEINAALKIEPIRWEHYYARAVCKLQGGHPPQSALEDFSRVRYLEPYLSGICEREAHLWLQYHPAYVVPALKEAMRRKPSGAPSYYQTALDQAHRFPELKAGLRTMAYQDSKLLLRYLTSFNDPKEFSQGLAQILGNDPKLKNFTAKEQLLLFQLWYSRGDKAGIIGRLEKNSEWRDHGWIVLAQHRAAQGDFQGAYKMSMDHLYAPFPPSSTRSTDLAQLRKNFLYNPTDFARGLEYYEALKDLGKIDEASSTLNHISQLPSAPAKLSYEQAQMLASKGDYSKAWERLQSYISLIGTGT